MSDSINYFLEPLDEDNPDIGYRAVVNTDWISEHKLAQALIEEGLPTDEKTILELFQAEQAATASLMWEGWDVAGVGGITETPWPNERLGFRLGGTHRGRAVADRELIAHRIMELGFKFRYGQISAYFTAQYQVMIELLSTGHEIEHPVFQMRPTIDGVFDDLEDEFDPNRHSKGIEGEVNPVVTDWLEGYRELESRKLGFPVKPILDSYDDVNTKETNKVLYIGHMVRLHGYWLRFWDSDPQQGIFFIAEDGTSTRYNVGIADRLNLIFFMVPSNLPPGLYWLEVRSIILPKDGLQQGRYPKQISILKEDEE